MYISSSVSPAIWRLWVQVPLAWNSDIFLSKNSSKNIIITICLQKLKKCKICQKSCQFFVSFYQSKTFYWQNYILVLILNPLVETSGQVVRYQVYVEVIATCTLTFLCQTWMDTKAGDIPENRNGCSNAHCSRRPYRESGRKRESRSKIQFYGK